MYLAVKHVHLLCVALSGARFFWRGLLMLRGSRWLASGWVRVVPHVNDTVLLVAGISLAVMSERYPFVDAWLTAKFFGLMLYIILGSLALKPGRTRRVRALAWLAALAVFGWMVSVAVLRQPAGFLVVFQLLQDVASRDFRAGTSSS